MDFSELTLEVNSIIQDNSWTEEMIEDLLNRALIAVSSGIILPGKFQLSPPLPALYSTGTVQTILDSGSCPLPANFNRELIQVVNPKFEDIPINTSFVSFLKNNPKQEAGQVRIVARNGLNLLYRDLPSSIETLTVHYYSQPTKMVLSGDIPDCIPEGLHKSLLVGYVCANIFNQIEDGIEGQKVNTIFWQKEFQYGLTNLEFLIEKDSLPDYYDDINERID